jgi:hypothetical protein
MKELYINKSIRKKLSIRNKSLKINSSIIEKNNNISFSHIVSWKIRA